MAKTVSDVFLRLKLDGKEQLEKLKSSFRGLEKTIGITDGALEQIRSELVSYNREGGASIAVLKGQVSALSDLQKQATIGGKVFRQLSKDVEAFERRLRQAETQANATERAVSFRATQGRFVSATPGGLFGKIAELQQAPQAERFIEGKGINPEYLRQQGELKVLLEAQTRIEARLQNAINATTKAKVDNNNESLTAAQITEKYSKGISTSANTTAQLSQRVRELRSDLRDLTFGSRDYGRVLAQINQLEDTIADPFGTAARKEQIRSRLGTQEQFGMFAGTDPVAKSIRRQQEKRARQAAPRQVPTQVREISGLYQQIGGIGMQGVRADIEMMGNSYQMVAKDIKAATAASNGSINSLQAQRGAWVTLRANLNPASKAYREVGKEIARVEKRLDGLTNKQKLSARIQGNLGAAAAGAVFGGPEAAIGGLVGGIGGAAVGAQAGMLRQNLAGTAEYAAEVNKLRIALEGVTGAGSDNARALEAIQDVVTQLNVPQEVATKGMTRLAAAVIGAKGNVGDAEIVFKNVTAAVKATGGSADDVNSAITAMVQVFSKGKVSAEELSGQLGERLPGAVTLFAEANNMSMVELQAALKAGTVGLNELMTFIISLGDRYADIAKKIADSSVDAGARAQVAFNELRLSIGESIQPLGGELQLAFAEFALDILPAITTGATAAAKGMKALLNASGFLISNLKELLVVAGAAGVALAFQNLVTLAGLLGTAVGALQVKIAALNLTMLLNPAVALAAGIAALSVVLYKAATAHDKFVDAVEKGEKSIDEAKKRTTELNDEIKKLEERLKKESSPRLINSLKRQIRELKKEIADIDLASALASPYTVAGVTYDRRTGKPISGHKAFDPTDFESPKPTGSGEGSGKRKMLQEELTLRDRVRQAVFKNNQLEKLGAEYALDKYLAALETEDPLKRENDLREALSKFEQGLLKYREDQSKEAERQNKLAEEAAKKARAFNAELQDRQYELGLITKEEYNRLLIERERARLKDAYPDLDPAKRDELADLKRREIDPTLQEGLQQNIATLKRELEELVDPINQITGAANAIGSAFSQSFASVINGSATAKEALASFFQNTANYFLDMAAQIIAKMIQMAILNSIVGLLPGGAGGGFNLGPASAAQGASYGGGAASGIFGGGDVRGFSFGGGGNFGGGFSGPKSDIQLLPFKPFAMGGIVKKPTMFAYADGGTGRFGLMGEQGTEAIMPLKRGPNGRLGVEASGGGTNVVVNVDASGSKAQGDQGNASALGRAIGAAVQAELIKQKRPGGLLA